jgi:signal transduction histidine kinase
MRGSPLRARWRAHRAARGSPPPRFIRQVGCTFAALIVLAAFGATTLVSLLFRSPERAVPIAVIGVAVLVLLTAGFARSIGGMARAFRDQVRLRRQLLADIAHELRTPLAILQGRIEGLLDGVYERDDARLTELLDETRHLARLVEDVGTLANAEAGALDLQKEPVDLEELARDAAASVPLTGGPTIAVEAAQPIPLVQADPTRIREVLLNLLTNAVRHTPPEGLVTVSVAAQGKSVVIRVTDTGSGIPADELPRIFERFHKGRDSRGTGLGLAISRDLVRAHGGEIHVESEPGKGTTVEVRLPD